MQLIYLIPCPVWAMSFQGGLKVLCGGTNEGVGREFRRGISVRSTRDELGWHAAGASL